MSLINCDCKFLADVARVADDCQARTEHHDKRRRGAGYARATI